MIDTVLLQSIENVKERFKLRGMTPPFYLYTPFELDLQDPELVIEVFDPHENAVSQTDIDNDHVAELAIYMTPKPM